MASPSVPLCGTTAGDTRLEESMKTLRRTCLLLVAAVAVPTTRATPPPAAAKDVEAALQNYARLQKAVDAAGLAASYTADGELLGPGMDALKGPAAIKKFLASFADVKMQAMSMTSEHTDVWGNDALQWGTYAQTVVLPDKKEPQEFHGRFVVQWAKQPDGRWLIKRLLTQPS